MTERYAMRAQKNLATEIAAFLADPSLGGHEITGMIDLLGKVGEVAIFGGMVRDLARGGASAFNSDVDLVVDGRPEDLERILIGLGASRNKYGGYRLSIERHSFDVWALSSTWAVRERLADAVCLADLVHTTFFDCDAVVYLCAERTVHLGPGFVRWLQDGIVDVNLAENPNPLGMAVRAQRIVRDWQEDLTPRLMSYVSSVLERISCEPSNGYQPSFVSCSRTRRASMRPSTLAEACRRAQAGEDFELALGDFLQSYYLAPGIEARVPMLADEPPRFADKRYDALVGGIAEYLFKRWAPWNPPPWIKSCDRYLDMPWWPIGEGNPALMEYLTWASPPEFKARNIMTDEEPLRRATQPPVEPLRRGL